MVVTCNSNILPALFVFQKLQVLDAVLNFSVFPPTIHSYFCLSLSLSLSLSPTHTHPNLLSYTQRVFWGNLQIRPHHICIQYPSDPSVRHKNKNMARRANVYLALTVCWACSECFRQLMHFNAPNSHLREVLLLSPFYK